jgi:Tfp pilus assembly protein PilO
MKVLRRIVVEKRAFLLPLALALVANLVAYAVVVYPLQTRVSSSEARRAEAERNRRAAMRELGDARATQTSKERAEADLKKFYRDVLPAGLPAARKAVYLRLAQLARACNVRYERQGLAEGRDARETELARLHVNVVLDGTYEDVRKFVHAVETAPEFLIVDTMGLAFRGEASSSTLVLTLSISTYYWTGAHES